MIPRSPSYFVCTVEAMPLDRSVDFLAIDEVQLAADRERGHVFTDRVAARARPRARRCSSARRPMRPLLRLLVPQAAVPDRARACRRCATATPSRSHRLPRRSAVVGVLAGRRLRGGGAAAPRERRRRARVRRPVAAHPQRAGRRCTRRARWTTWSPPTRSAWASTSTSSTWPSPASSSSTAWVRAALRPAEVAQIAGRAGRHVQDGTFGATAELGPFQRDLVDAVENHRFDPLTRGLLAQRRTSTSPSPRRCSASLERRAAAARARAHAPRGRPSRAGGARRATRR